MNEIFFSVVLFICLIHIIYFLVFFIIRIILIIIIIEYLSHRLISKAMENWRVDLTAGGQTLAEAKIQRGIFQKDSLLPRQFKIRMMPLNYIFRKCTGAYKFTKLQEKINHLVYMDDLKIFVKNEKDLDSNKKKIEVGYRNGIWHWKMGHAHKNKQD